MRFFIHLYELGEESLYIEVCRDRSLGLKLNDNCFPLTVNGPHDLLQVSPDGGEADGPGPGAGGYHHRAVTGPELVTDAGQAVVPPPFIYTPRLNIIIFIDDIIIPSYHSHLNIHNAHHRSVIRLLQLRPAVENQRGLLPTVQADACITKEIVGSNKE